MEFKIIQKLTPNKFSRNGWKPDIIVSHITEGGYLGAVSWLMNPVSQASAHFVVSKKGEITQLVDVREAAWINGTSENPTSLKFYGHSSLQSVRERKTNANFYSVGIEHEGFYSTNRGKLTDLQLQATIWLHKHIISEVKRIYGTDITIDRNHIVGHYQVNPITKPNCPGQNFQWDELLFNLRTQEEQMEEVKRYAGIKDMPEWMKPYVLRWIEKGFIKGDGNNLNLTEDMIRTLVVVERMLGGK